MALSRLQQEVASLVSELAARRGFALAGGSGLAAHGMLNRLTRDLDYFGPSDAGQQVLELAREIEDACRAEGLVVLREREAHTFVRLTVSDAAEQCEVDIAIDYRALSPVDTKHGLALDLRELAANKVLALFDRAAPRDFLDLAQLTERFALEELLELALHKDPGLDLGILDHAMGSVQRFPPDRLHLTQEEYEALLATVEDWRRRIRDQQRRAD